MTTISGLVDIVEWMFRIGSFDNMKAIKLQVEVEVTFYQESQQLLCWDSATCEPLEKIIQWGVKNVFSHPTG